MNCAVEEVSLDDFEPRASTFITQSRMIEGEKKDYVTSS